MSYSTRRGVVVALCALAAGLACDAAPPLISTTDWPGVRRIMVSASGGTIAVPQEVRVGYAFNYTISSPLATSFNALNLPRGLSVSQSSGVISGRPEVAGTFAVTVQATNSDGTTSVNASLVVEPAPTAPPVVTSGAMIEVTPMPAGRDVPGGGGYLIRATNGPTSFAADGLPAGVSLDPAYGVIIYPFLGTAPGLHTTTLRATNALGTGTGTIRWTVHPYPTNFTSDKRVYAIGETVNIRVAFNGPVVVTGTPTVRVGANSIARYTSGSGSPTLTFSFVATMADRSPGRTFVTESIVLNGGTIATPDGVSAVLGKPSERLVDAYSFDGIYPLAPEITSAGRATGQVWQPFSFSITASNLGRDFTIVSGALPRGLTLRTLPAADGSSTGLISGTPEEAGDFSLSVRASNLGQSGTVYSAAAALVVSIAAATTTTPPPVTTPPPTIPPTPPSLPPPPPPAVAPPTAPRPPVAVPQTIDFVAPVSAIIIGQPIELGATSSAGLPIEYAVASGNATIRGTTLTVHGPGSVVIRALQPGSDTVLPATAEITITAIRGAQTITLSAPLPSELVSDGRLTLAATSTSGLPVQFEVISGPAILTGGILRPTAAGGTVVLRAAQGGNDAFDATATTHTLTILPATRLINLSSRVRVQAGDGSRAFIAGFVITGTEPKRILARVVGPGLSAFGVDAALLNPRLRIYNHSGQVIAENDDWSGADLSAAGMRVGAFALSAGSRDAMHMATLQPGAYTLHAEAVAGEGVVLAEIYDASDNPALESQQLINLSTRAFVDTGEGVLTAGFVVTGSRPKRVLIRGIGPSLGAFGVPGALADPSLKLYRGTTVIAENDDWQSSEPLGTTQAAAGPDISVAANTVGAFPLQTGTKDAALLLTLAPGAYTATVSGANNSTGAGLVEVYEVR